MAKDIYENIDDVKCSLDNAQRSFRKNNGLRGELDLMLAEASIRYLREKRGFASVWNRQKLAAALAVLLVLAGYGGWWYAGITHDIEEKLYRQQLFERRRYAGITHDIEEKPQVVQNAAVQQAEPQMQQTGKADKTRQDDAVKAAEPAESNIKNNTNYKNYLAETDMQQLVRTGRQVLQDAD